MRIAVVGLWHLGLVTAACLARTGHDIVAFDDDDQTIRNLRHGHLPVFEPGLEDLVQTGQSNGRLRFTSDSTDLRDRDLVWVTYDTPVDVDDRADVESVVRRVAALFPDLAVDPIVLISSQLLVGTTARLQSLYREAVPGGRAAFVYSPENLRLGRAIDAFTRPSRVVIGVRSEQDRQRLEPLFGQFSSSLLWMSVESAEMAKHALNAFLATSVAYANELAVLCERVGADSREVEQALRSDDRVGRQAYVRAGSAFAGGTLARDLSFLVGLGEQVGAPTHLFSGVRTSNATHLGWVRTAMLEAAGDLRGREIGVLGLTYKPGTNTLRRSSAIEICRWLADQRATVRAYDPAVKTLPPELNAVIGLQTGIRGALQGSDAVLVATEWPEFLSLCADEVVELMRRPIVVDPGRFLEANLGTSDRIRYLAVGMGR